MKLKFLFTDEDNEALYQAIVHSRDSAESIKINRLALIHLLIDHGRLHKHYEDTSSG